MIFKLKQFRNAHEKAVQEIYEKDGENALAMYCAVSFCPVLAAYWFCREFDSSNPELTRRIESVIIFYAIKEVQE